MLYEQAKEHSQTLHETKCSKALYHWQYRFLWSIAVHPNVTNILRLLASWSKKSLHAWSYFSYTDIRCISYQFRTATHTPVITLIYCVALKYYKRASFPRPCLVVHLER